MRIAYGLAYVKHCSGSPHQMSALSVARAGANIREPDLYQNRKQWVSTITALDSTILRAARLLTEIRELSAQADKLCLHRREQIF